ncbi:sialin isoform X2 [Cimex lectularius]|uniref:Major facilitator superfamily (MFS) profile domain-containing protein n=1 Tax=Cimex lectularius TaxID=79782 RepID=A0A8I6R849_CIMLE|nr:sialin isoform X2 [Cimex lectularius]
MPSPKKGFFSRLNEKISCVQILNVLVFFSFMVNYMLRVNITIAIVAMVDDSNSTTVATNETVETTKFQWDTRQRNLIYGSFFWGYVFTELPGGRLAEVIGAKKVFGASLFIASFITLFTPLVAHLFDFIGVVILRVLIGFMLGVTFPAMQPMASKWIPPKDRTKFVSNMMASSLGAAVTLPISGFLIDYYNWETVFYVTGLVGLTWSVAWYFLMFDSPSEHPRITVEEKDYLEKAIGESSTTKIVHNVPWRQMLTSMPVWAIVVTHASSVFCYFTFLNQFPTYMKHVLGLDIKQNGILSSFPYIGKYVMALITSYIADYVRGTGKLSTTAIRKIFTTFAVGVPGLLMVAEVFLGQSTVWTVTIFTLALTLNGAVTAGYLGNGLDIAPNFSGTIFGMANTLSSLGGFVSTYIVGSLTFQNETYERFQIVFWILAVMYAIGCVMYLVFGTGQLQSWNTPSLPVSNGDVNGEKKNGFSDVELAEKQPLKL